MGEYCPLSFNLQIKNSGYPPPPGIWPPPSYMQLPLKLAFFLLHMAPKILNVQTWPQGGVMHTSTLCTFRPSFCLFCVFELPVCVIQPGG